MPYLKWSRKMELDKGKLPKTPGDLTYLLSRELIKVTTPRRYPESADYHKYITSYLGESPNFASYAEVLGAIQATIFEFKRRKGLLHYWQQEEIHKLENVARALYIAEIGPYEDSKIAENGDIYE